MKEKPQELERLKHMIEAANNILEFTDGIDYERFVRDKILQFAVVKNFEIVGEAAYHLSKELRDKTKNQIEWQKVIAFRHILVHDYWKIDYEVVWNSKETKLPAMIEALEKILEAYDK